MAEQQNGGTILTPGAAPDPYKPGSPRLPDLSIFGRRGLRQFSGFTFEEWLPELQGERGRRVYKEMRDNDPVIGAILFGIEMLMRQVPWRTDPGEDDAQGDKDTELVDQSFNDMTESWPDLLSEIITFTWYGWAYFETIYKLRGGTSTDDMSEYSKYDDGLIGWRQFAVRAQDSLLRWEFDPDSDDLVGMYQIPPPDYIERYIPYAKSILFRTANLHGNPEGRSLLRNIYEPWYFGKHIARIEAIGIERDLAGFPVVWVPGRMLRADATEDDRLALQDYQQTVRNIRRDEQEGAVMPLEYDPITHQRIFDLTLLSTGGQRQFDTDKIVMRYDSRKAMVMLADFILLGHEQVGSWALESGKRGMFETALGAYLDVICQPFNDKAIPELIRLNGRRKPGRETPKRAHGDIAPADLEVLGQYLYNLQQAGVLPKTPELTAYLLEVANLPIPPDEVLQEQVDQQVRYAPQPHPGVPPGPDELDAPEGSQDQGGKTVETPAAGRLTVVESGKRRAGRELLASVWRSSRNRKWA